MLSTIPCLTSRTQVNHYSFKTNEECAKFFKEAYLLCQSYVEVRLLCIDLLCANISTTRKSKCVGKKQSSWLNCGYEFRPIGVIPHRWTCSSARLGLDRDTVPRNVGLNEAPCMRGWLVVRGRLCSTFWSSLTALPRTSPKATLRCSISGPGRYPIPTWFGLWFVWCCFDLSADSQGCFISSTDLICLGSQSVPIGPRSCRALQTNTFKLVKLTMKVWQLLFNMTLITFRIAVSLTWAILSRWARRAVG